MEKVPIIDLSADRAICVAQVDAALKQFGFFYVCNHGIEAELIQQQFDVAANLFALPLEAKQAMPFNAQLDIGYAGTGEQSLDPDGKTQHTGDTKEQFVMTNNKLISDPTAVTDPNDVFAESINYQPDISNHAPVSKAYMSAAFKLNLRLNDLLFAALQLDSHQRQALGAQPFLVLKQMRYAGEPSNPAAGKFGAGAHADWGSFTILATDATPGLQTQMQNDWLPVPPVPGCLIINSGDQIAQLTNDGYRSAIHRVVTASATPRYSTAVFTYFGMHAIVEPLQQFVSDQRPARYPSGRTTDEYFHYKLTESMGSG
jgi:isopenicillin N synthase-like dioxygenase